MSVRVLDLKDYRGPGPHPMLYCECCGAEYSANKGDYFLYPPEHIFTCCEQEMVLVVVKTIRERVAV